MSVGQNTLDKLHLILQNLRPGEVLNIDRFYSEFGVLRGLNYVTPSEDSVTLGKCGVLRHVVFTPQEDLSGPINFYIIWVLLTDHKTISPEHAEKYVHDR